MIGLIQTHVVNKKKYHLLLFALHHIKDDQEVACDVYKIRYSALLHVQAHDNLQKQSK